MFAASFRSVKKQFAERPLLEAWKGTTSVAGFHAADQISFYPILQDIVNLSRRASGQRVQVNAPLK
jgi:hypothetical protein